MSRLKNTLAVRHKGLRLNIGIDPHTNEQLRLMAEAFTSRGLKRPSTSLLVRHSLRCLYAALRTADEDKWRIHQGQLKALS